MLRNTATGYGAVNIAFHWLMAVLIAGLLIVGMYMHSLPLADPNKFWLYQLHKSFGLTALGLVVLRLLWRFANPIPKLPVAMPGWQKAGAHLSHLTLYGLMFAIPLSGWLMASASPLGIPTLYFDLFQVPHLPVPAFLGDAAAAEETMKTVHDLLGKLLILVLIAHVAAALKHHLIDKDDIFKRMISTRPARSDSNTG